MPFNEATLWGALGNGILANIGSFLGGFSLLLAATAAWYGTVRVTQRNFDKDATFRMAQNDQAIALRKKDAVLRSAETFRLLYIEVWRTGDVSDIRRCIINDEEYKELKEVLLKRNSSVRNILDREENNVIEKVDRFCSTMVRILSFLYGEEMDERQKELWTKLFVDFWIGRVRDDPERKELHDYMITHWKELGDEILLPKHQTAGAKSTV